MRTQQKIPSLAWLIAQRVSNPGIELDCSIMVTGKKGSGKSIFCVGLAYEISRVLAIKHNRKEIKLLVGKAREDRIDELALHYFNMKNVKSVDADGTMAMFSGDTLMTPNSVLLCDDISIAANSRSSMTNQNKALSQIMTVSRPFRNVVIMNTIYSSLVDKVARNFSDIVIELLGVDLKNKRSVAKVYLYTVNQTTGREYKKFFRFDGKRVKYWLSYLPPKYLMEAYHKLRMEKTKELIDGFHDDHIERTTGGTSRQKKREEIINTHRDEVVRMYEAGDSIKSIIRTSPDLSEYWVNAILGQHKKEQRLIERKVE